MSFLSQLSADAAATFITDFAESVPYTPWQAAQLNFPGIVERDASGLFAQAQGAAGYRGRITLVNDPAGVAGPAKISKGKDFVMIAKRLGQDPEKFTVLDIPEHDQGIWVLEVGQG